MRMRTAAARMAVGVIVVAVAASVAPGADAQGRPEQPGSPAAHWNAERRAAAIPRDLVIDEQGRGYLRHPDGTLEPYGSNTTPPAPASGRQLHAQSSPTPTAKPSGNGGGSTDTTPPVISNRDPAAGATIGASHTFTADVTDDSGLRSVTFVIVYPDETTTQSFSASFTGGSTYSVPLQGFTDGPWSWYVVAKDTAKRGGNTAMSPTTLFTVNTGSGGGGGGGGGGDVVSNAVWPGTGDVQAAAGRLYFEMPANRKQTRWSGYVCSATTVTDQTLDRSIILTAAHCVYDDANKTFARNVLFIPDQASTTGSGTDLNCSNDEYGCWSPSLGVVDADWANRTWPSNIPWDYGFYVVADVGAHSGNGSGGALDELSSMTVSFSAPSTGTTTAALGYSYSDDPKFMYCRESLGVDGSGWFLPNCGLSGGASGGPWLQPVSGGDGPIVSVNSYTYTDGAGMGGPKLDSTSSASCLFGWAKTVGLSSAGLIPSGC